MSPDRCAYCAGQTFDPWLEGVTDRLGVAPGTFTFWRCRACGSGVLHPSPKPEELAALYPEVYSFHSQVGSARAMVNRALGAAVTLGSLPLCWIEGHVAHRPATAFVLAQKPA